VADLFGGAHLDREIFTGEVRASRGHDRWGLGWTDRLWHTCRDRTGLFPGGPDYCHGQPNHTNNDQKNPPVLDEDTDRAEGQEYAKGA
jgi:hypothetical protein